MNGTNLYYDTHTHTPYAQTPFYASTSERIIAKVKAGSWSFKAACWSSVSDLAKDLIKGLLQASCIWDPPCTKKQGMHAGLHKRKPSHLVQSAAYYLQYIGLDRSKTPMTVYRPARLSPTLG